MKRHVRSVLCLLALCAAAAVPLPAQTADDVDAGPPSLRPADRCGSDRWDGLDTLMRDRRGREPEMGAGRKPYRHGVIFRDGVTGAEKWYLGRVDADPRGPHYGVFNADGTRLAIRLRAGGGAVLVDLARLEATATVPLEAVIWDRKDVGVLYGIERKPAGVTDRLVRYEWKTGTVRALCDVGKEAVLRECSEDGRTLLWSEGGRVVVVGGVDGKAGVRVDAGGPIEDLCFLRGGGGSVYVREAGRVAGRVWTPGTGAWRDLEAPGWGAVFGAGGAALSAGNWRWNAAGTGAAEKLFEVEGEGESRRSLEARAGTHAVAYVHAARLVGRQEEPINPYDEQADGSELLRVDIGAGVVEVLGSANDNHPEVNGWQDSLFVCDSPDGSKVFYLSTMLGDVGAYVLTIGTGGKEPSGKAPGAVTGLKVVGTEPDHVTLAWALPAGGGVRYCNVYASRGPDVECGPATLVGSAMGGVTGWTDWGLDPEQDMYYRVTAVGPGGMESAPSAVLRARTPPLPSDLPRVTPPHVAAAPTIDGVLDDACWKQAIVTPPFRDFYGKAVPRKNVAHFCQQDDMLYIAVVCEADEKALAAEAKTTRHDDPAFWMDDCVEIFIDPDRLETPGYYQIGITKDAVVMDAFNSTPRDLELKWEPGDLDKRYAIATAKGKGQWTVEAALPLTVFTRTKVYDTIGMNVLRGSSWSPLRMETSHYPRRFGIIEGLTGLVPESTKPPAFVEKPAFVAWAGGGTVSFRAERRTDVAVWIENGAGETVRRLAGGMLGPNAPAPLAANSLEQSVVWDGKDDFGNSLPAGVYRAKVGLGLDARLDRMIGWRRQPGGIVGLGVGPDGSLYVHGSSTISGNQVIMRYDRKGAYKGTVFPPPASMPLERLPGLSAVRTRSGDVVRFGLNRLGAYLPGIEVAGPVTVLANRSGQVISMGGEYPAGLFRLFKVNGDGSLPADWRGPWIKDMHWRDWFGEEATRVHLALDAQDEDVVYVSGIRETHHFNNKDRRFLHTVQRVRWGREGMPETFLGEPWVAGNDESHFDNPQGICTDGEGNLWVADQGNDRIMIFRRDGTFLRSFATRSPYYVRVDPRTAESYVMECWTPEDAAKDIHGVPEVAVILKKYSAEQPPAELFATELCRTWAPCWLSMTLDASGPAPVVRYVRESQGRAPAGERVFRIVDRGDRFGDPVLESGDDACHIKAAVSWDDETVLTQSGAMFDGKTGRPETSMRGFMHGHLVDDIQGGRDGRWYSVGGYYPAAITVMDTNGATILRHILEPEGGNRAGKRGFTVAPNGDIYVLRYYNFWGQTGDGSRDSAESIPHHVACDIYGWKDGKLVLKRQRVIAELSPGAASPAVDPAGNIYVCDNNGRRIGQLYEADLEGRLDDLVPDIQIDWERLRQGKPDWAGAFKFVNNRLIGEVGTVYKFGPSGGALIYREGMGHDGRDVGQVMHQRKETRNADGSVLLEWVDWGFPAEKPPSTPPTHWSSRLSGRLTGVFPSWQRGVEWEWLGAAPLAGRYNLQKSACICHGLRMTVDDFGRLFVPAAHRQAVQVLDTAGNPVCRIGEYGNADSWGPASPEPGPAIPLSYPTMTVLSKHALYIVDGPRIARVLLGYRCEAEAGEVRLP